MTSRTIFKNCKPCFCSMTCRNGHSKSSKPNTKTLFFHDIYFLIPKYLCKGCSPKFFFTFEWNFTHKNLANLCLLCHIKAGRKTWRYCIPKTLCSFLLQIANKWRYDIALDNFSIYNQYCCKQYGYCVHFSILPFAIKFGYK
jgi:hypothetical protein